MFDGTILVSNLCHLNFAKRCYHFCMVQIPLNPSSSWWSSHLFSLFLWSGSGVGACQEMCNGDGDLASSSPRYLSRLSCSRQGALAFWPSCEYQIPLIPFFPFGFGSPFIKITPMDSDHQHTVPWTYTSSFQLIVSMSSVFLSSLSLQSSIFINIRVLARLWLEKQ